MLFVLYDIHSVTFAVVYEVLESHFNFPQKYPVQGIFEEITSFQSLLFTAFSIGDFPPTIGRVNTVPSIAIVSSMPGLGNIVYSASEEKFISPICSAAMI